MALGCGPSDPVVAADGSTGGSDSSTGSSQMTSMTGMTTMPDTADTTAGDSSSDDSPVTATDSGTTSTTDPTTGDPTTDSTGGTTDSTGGTTDGTTDSTGGTTEVSGESSGSSSDTGGGTDPGTSGSTGDLVPDGGSCSADEECVSGECYLVGILGGVCGECNEDADCADGGCTLPNPLNGTPPVCNMGLLGEGCETTDVCDTDLVCALIIDIPGLVSASTCSECETDADCGMDTCQPDYDLPNFSGVNECVMPGSLADGHGCDLVTGDAACASGHCAQGNLMMILFLGVCSECEVDGDCGPGETCVEPDIDLMGGLTAGMCV